MSPLPSGSLTALMNGLTAAQATVGASPLLATFEPLTYYRWRDDAPDAPALWNSLSPETSAQHDTSRRIDSFFIETRIGVNPIDSDEWYLAMEAYCDAYRSVMDPIFRREVSGSVGTPLFAGAARWAERQSLAPFAEEFGGTWLRGIAFVQRFDVDRIVVPS